MMNAVVKPYHEMCLNSSELIVPRDTYQRALHPARVARIAKEFDERVANEPKISFRDGHYYVMDGQNTIAARKFLNGGEDLQIRCKVYFGMTEREEALLFAQQTGISERLSAGQKLRALIFAGEPAAVAFQQAPNWLAFIFLLKKAEANSGSAASQPPIMSSSGWVRNCISKPSMFC